MDFSTIDLEQIWNYLTTAVFIASAITAATPTPKDDNWLAKIYYLIETFGLVVGRAKEKGPKG